MPHDPKDAQFNVGDPVEIGPNPAPEDLRIYPGEPAIVRAVNGDAVTIEIVDGPLNGAELVVAVTDLAPRGPHTHPTVPL